MSVVVKTKPVMKDFHFPWESGHLHVRVRQGRVGDSEARNAVYSAGYFNPQTQVRIECFRTLCYLDLIDEEGNHIFRFRDDKVSMLESEFYDAWEQLDDDLAAVIHDCVALVNPQWYRLDFLIRERSDSPAVKEWVRQYPESKEIEPEEGQEEPEGE